MSQAIYWAKLEDLSPAIGAIPPAPDTLMLLERLPLTWLDQEALATGLRFERFNPQEPFNRWERGRIFNEAGELRWEKIDHYFQTVYVGTDEIELPEPFSRDETLPLGEPAIHCYYLWGKRLEAEALETMGRLPTAQVFAEFAAGGILAEYPVAEPGDRQAGRVRIEIAVYIDPDTQERLYYRFQGVKWDESV